MKTIFSNFILFLFVGTLCSQPTVSVGLQRSDFSEWDEYFTYLFNDDLATDYLEETMVLGIGQMLPLKNERIVFHPNITIANFEKINPGEHFFRGSGSVTFEMYQVNLNLGTKIYLFDLIKNFRKVDQVRDKKDWKNIFYLLLNPGLSMVRHKYVNKFSSATHKLGAVDRLYFRESIGAGFDVRFGKLMTLSPFLAWNKIRNFSNQVLVDQGESICTGCGLTNRLSEEDFVHFTFGLNVVLDFLR